MTTTRLQIPISEGKHADAYLSSPSGPGSWPGVLMLMDAIG